MNGNDRRRVCIFGASSPAIAQEYIDAAYAVGRLIAENGMGMVFGGGDTGLMGAAARGVHAANGELIGVIPERLNQPGIAFAHCSELIVTEDMHRRKATMERLSSAYIALPGGMGTLEELLEVLTLNQLGYLSAPVVILNTRGYYSRLLSQLDNCVAEGFMNPAYKGLYAVAATPEEAIGKLTGFTMPELPNKMKEALKRNG